MKQQTDSQGRHLRESEVPFSKYPSRALETACNLLGKPNNTSNPLDLFFRYRPVTVMLCLDVAWRTCSPQSRHLSGVYWCADFGSARRNHLFFAGPLCDSGACVGFLELAINN